jgi:predicted transcriptional regulator
MFIKNLKYNIMDINDLVFKTLKETNEPMRPGDIATKSGLDKKDVDKAIKNLVQESKIYSPKRCFYGVKK